MAKGKGAAHKNTSYGGVDPMAAPMTGVGKGKNVKRMGAHSDIKSASDAYKGMKPKR